MDIPVPNTINLAFQGIVLAFFSSLLVLSVYEPRIEGLGGRWMVNIQYFLLILAGIGYLIMSAQMFSINQGAIGATFILFGLIALAPLFASIWKYISGMQTKNY